LPSSFAPRTIRDTTSPYGRHEEIFVGKFFEFTKVPPKILGSPKKVRQSGQIIAPSISHRMHAMGRINENSDVKMAVEVKEGTCGE